MTDIHTPFTAFFATKHRYPGYPLVSVWQVYSRMGFTHPRVSILNPLDPAESK